MNAPLHTFQSCAVGSKGLTTHSTPAFAMAYFKENELLIIQEVG